MSKSFVGESNGLPNSAFYSLKWNKFHTHLSKGLNQLLEDVDFTDVTLACDGNCLRSHKMVLSLCSPFFKRIFKTNRSEIGSTVVILNNVRFADLQNIIRFVYNGQVDIKHSDLTSFLQAAELLQIEGLAGTLAQAQEDQNSQAPPPPTQDDASSSSALVGSQVQISPSSHGTFPSDNFHSHSDNSNSHSSTFSTLLQGSHNIPTSPPVAKRSKTCFSGTAPITPLTPPVVGKSLHTAIKSNHTFRSGFNSAPSTISRVEQEQERQEIKFNDNNDDVVVIDPLHEDPLHQNYQEQDMLNISEKDSSLVGIFPDDKVEEEQEVFLDSEPPDIRIEGVFSTSHPSPASSRIASTSSANRQLKPGGNYSVADEIDDEETETLPQTIANFGLSTFNHSQSSKNKRKLSTELVKQEFQDKSPFFSDMSENKSDSNEFKSRSSLLCSLCSQTFTSSLLLKAHKTNCHPEESVTCPVCFKKYKNKNSLKVHKSVNHRNSIVLPPDMDS